MHRKFSVALAAIITCLFVWSPCYGQSLPKEKQAELAFEIRWDALRGTPLYEMMAQNIEEIRSEMPGEIDIDKINRIWGAIQFPETIDEMEAMDNMQPGDDFPVEMFVHIEFADAEAADAAMKVINEEADEVEKDGKTYFAPKEGDEAPANLIGHRLNSTTIEAGTEGYVLAGAGEKVFSSGLGTAWDSFDGEAIRVAFDLDNARDLINQGLEMAKADAPPMAHGMLDLFNKANDFRIAIDLKDGGNILKIASHGTDEEAAEELRSGLDGMLGMAKMMGGGAVEELRAQDEGLADVMSAILSSLNATRDGTNVEIAIPKPDGFEDAIKGIMEMNGMGSDF